MISKSRLDYLIEHPEQITEEEAEIIKDLHGAVTEVLERINTWVEVVKKDIQKGEIGMKISELVKLAHNNAKDKGFWDNPRETGTLLALIHSEASEALEADRNGDRDNFEEELADILIRVADLAGGKGIDLESAVTNKIARNFQRSYKHGKEY